jgi:hypothetical protein
MEFETPLGRIILQFTPKKIPDSLRPSRERPSAVEGWKRMLLAGAKNRRLQLQLRY